MIDVMRRANVYCLGILAGVLTKDDTGYRFQYDPEYLRDSRYPAISLTFPKRDEAFESTVLFPYFFGLLAEGDNKTIQCRVMRIDERDHFTRLLKTCTTETIGGVTVKEIK
jgi:serine/threonine-protein kinase HipA